MLLLSIVAIKEIPYSSKSVRKIRGVAMKDNRIVKMVVFFIPFLVCAACFFKVKPEGQAIITGVMAFFSIMGLLLKDPIQDLMMKLIIFIVFTSASIIAVFLLAIWISPPVTPDGHPVMPLGQLFVSFPIGIVLSLIMCFLYFKKIRIDRKLESYLLLGFTSILLIELMFDYLI